VEFQINQGKSDMGTIGYWIIMLLAPINLVSRVLAMRVTFYGKLYFFVNNMIYGSDHAPGYAEFYPLLLFILLNSILYFVGGYFIGLLIDCIAFGIKKLGSKSTRANVH
jgi:hypothetical protein